MLRLLAKRPLDKLTQSVIPAHFFTASEEMPQSQIAIILKNNIKLKNPRAVGLFDNQALFDSEYASLIHINATHFPDSIASFNLQILKANQTKEVYMAHLATSAKISYSIPTLFLANEKNLDLDHLRILFDSLVESNHFIAATKVLKYFPLPFDLVFLNSVAAYYAKFALFADLDLLLAEYKQMVTNETIHKILSQIPNDLQMSNKYFTSIKTPNAQSWSHLLTAFAKRGKEGDVKLMFNAYKKKLNEPLTSATYAAMIECQGRATGIRAAQQYFYEIENFDGVGFDVEMVGSLIVSYAVWGDFLSAWKLIMHTRFVMDGSPDLPLKCFVELGKDLAEKGKISYLNDMLRFANPQSSNAKLNPTDLDYFCNQIMQSLNKEKNFNSAIKVYELFLQISNPDLLQNSTTTSITSYSTANPTKSNSQFKLSSKTHPQQALKNMILSSTKPEVVQALYEELKVLEGVVVGNEVYEMVQARGLGKERVCEEWVERGLAPGVGDVEMEKVWKKMGIKLVVEKFEVEKRNLK